MADNDKIGFGKPPKAHQWQKGQSGNPKGRPKLKSDFIADFANILSEPVTACQPGGRTIKLDGLEASYLQLCKKGLKGNNAALFAALKIMLEILPEGQKVDQQRFDESAGAKEKLLAMAFGDIE